MLNIDTLNITTTSTTTKTTPPPLPTTITTINHVGVCLKIPSVTSLYSLCSPLPAHTHTQWDKGGRHGRPTTNTTTTAPSPPWKARLTGVAQGTADGTRYTLHIKTSSVVWHITTQDYSLMD
ncbi:hypothetical protein E2C01_012566 [Portunus trituberculatus]|uniref:Uncharacterized protein n=1 Tax=Portunus trituberculatus TaxID=210409 RepID=A0A5B7DEG0_PORTR|nr:hypothetical protein [Portunus trituberculatus]